MPMEELSERDKVQKDLLWDYYAELRATARQIETTRSSATNYAMLVASALIAVVALDKVVDANDRALCLVLVVVSLFATFYSFAYAERYVKNKRRAEFVMAEIDRRFFGDQPEAARLRGIKHEADAAAGEYDQTFRLINRVTVSSHLFWIIVPATIFVLGCLLLLQTFVG
ncbi:hypothetical protein [Actinoplanes sp. NPDC048796]|uniref:hypothetical protein n=1 Tax=Actinoplanes sp. NPDC048796 TaxID=3155640 RepID=UPI0033DF9159